MAEIVGKPTVLLSVTFSLNEEEARAIDALTGYSDDAILKVLINHLGAGLEKHETGFRSLFTTTRKSLAPLLIRVDQAREAFSR